MENKPITVRLPNELRVLFNQFVAANFHASENAAIVAIVQRLLTKPEGAAPVVVPQNAAPAAAPVSSAEVAELRAELEKIRARLDRTQKMAEAALNGAVMEVDFNAHRHGEDGRVIIPDGEEDRPEPTKIEAGTGAVLERGGGRIVDPPPAVPMVPAARVLTPEEIEASKQAVAEIMARGQAEEAERMKASQRKAKERIRESMLADVGQLSEEDWAGLWKLEDELGIGRTARGP